MKIGFLVERATQFEAPFYRFAAADPAHRLRVLFTDQAPGASVFDSELERRVSWGIDLLGGYDHALVPSAGRAEWLHAELRDGGYDLLIVNGYTRRAYLEGVLAARRAGVPVGLRIDSIDASGVVLPGLPGRQLAKRLLFALALRPMFRLFFATGGRARQYLESMGVPSERIALFPYAIDVAEFRRRSALEPAERSAQRVTLGLHGAPAVLSLAKLNDREAPWDLLDAFARLPEPRPWLVIAGDGPQRGAVETRARELGLSRVRFLGYVPYPELPALYGAVELFVHAPREERWGVSVQEALACGLPVVASERVGAAFDLVRAGVNGFVYPPGNIERLAEVIRLALMLRPAIVAARSRALLTEWDYAATWRGILAAARALV